MTRYRGYKRETSKFGETEHFEEKPYEAIEKPKVYATVDIKDLIVRTSPQGEVACVLHQGDKVEILETVDSKWVQVAAPSGITGFAGSQFLTKEV